MPATSIFERLKKLKDLLTKVSQNVARPFTYIDMREIRKEIIELTRMKESFTSSELKLSENVNRLMTMLRETRPELFSKQDFVRTSKLQVAKVNPIVTSAHCHTKKTTKSNPGPSKVLRSSQGSVSIQANSEIPSSETPETVSKDFVAEPIPASMQYNEDFEIPETVSENFVAPTPSSVQSAAPQIVNDTQDTPMSEIPSSLVQRPTSGNVRRIMRTRPQHDSPLVAAGTVNEVNVEDEVKQYKLWAIELRDVLMKQQKQG